MISLGQTKRFVYPALLWISVLMSGHWFVHSYHEYLTAQFSLFISLASQFFILFVLVVIAALLLRFQKNRPKRYIMLALWLAIIVAAHNIIYIDGLSREETLIAMHLGKGLHSLIFITLLYALLLAIPFVPGLEIGIIIMLLFGVQGVFAAYIATVSGLTLSFLIGLKLSRTLKSRTLIERWFSWKKIDLILGKSWANKVLKYRYLLLGLLLNLPGNTLLGGGGGISLLSGLSGHYKVRGFILTVVIAVSPLPILILFGIISAENLFSPR